ncbi:class I SAM-dependent methyltransferase [Aquimarina sp. ERC-38]|uniref:class I SAM-dependent methyltransferase n=1 Tax=Aquimarina sp. ERC-38 TaxID=2949996 RepID=UPI0022456E2E|nr:class I SAM-dependent methyltransferase [Aquimarina sp. ERC-38]UZO80733.1 class I SAM-dependent methyltransferase [Aquimarina sp. ERC-38]
MNNNIEDSVRKTKKPWPTREAMAQVYDLNLWGGNTGEFYSGEGSHHPGLVTPYLDAVISFLSSFTNPISICDLGCGDFNVGKELLLYTRDYIAVDIVPNLIAYHQKRYTRDHLEFYCLNIAKDTLPPARCAILRQVLQHLSNSEIQQIVPKLAHYQYVLLTEHLPKGDFIANKDIISGQGTRLKKNSGVDLLVPPFSFQAVAVKELLSIDLDTISSGSKGKIVTVLYRMF